jgi:regulator of replication initiation timing
MTELVEQLTNLAKEIQELRKQVALLQQQRDDYKCELDKLFHSWSRDDLDEWAANKGIEITENQWHDWCNYWDSTYNLQYTMETVMEEWWENRKRESLDTTN